MNREDRWDLWKKQKETSTGIQGFHSGMNVGACAYRLKSASNILVIEPGWVMRIVGTEVDGSECALVVVHHDEAQHSLLGKVVGLVHADQRHALSRVRALHPWQHDVLAADRVTVIEQHEAGSSHFDAVVEGSCKSVLHQEAIRRRVNLLFKGREVLGDVDSIPSEHSERSGHVGAEIGAGIVPHHHCLPLGKHVRDSDGLPRVAAVVQGVHLHPVRESTPVVDAMVEGSRRLEFGPNSVDNTVRIQQVAAVLRFQSVIDENNGRKGKLDNKRQDAVNDVRRVV